MTLDADPENQDNGGDDEFAKHFNDFAAAKATPQSEAPQNEVQSEGNVPDEQKDQAPEKTAADDPKPAESDTSDDTKGGDKQPPEDKQPDILATLSPEARALVEQLQKERDEARQRASSDAGRVSALTKKLQSLAPPPEKAEEPSEAQKALDAKITKLREDYGEIADPLIELMEQQRKELGRVTEITEAISEERREALIRDQLQELEARHPDWRQVATSEEFGNWLKDQPENIQRLAGSWDARESSVALTLFKSARAEESGQSQQKVEDPKQAEAKATTDAKRQSQLDGGRDVRSKPAPATSGPPEDFDTAFDYFVQERQRKAAQARR